MTFEEWFGKEHILADACEYEIAESAWYAARGDLRKDANWIEKTSGYRGSELADMIRIS